MSGTKNRIKIIFLVLLCSLMISCVTRTAFQALPEFEPIRPERPQLEAIDGDIPPEVTINTIRLMEYARYLEIYADAWEAFYTRIQEERNAGKN